MTSMDVAATGEAKLEFERFPASRGVTIKHYHRDNVLYGTKKFKASINTASLNHKLLWGKCLLPKW